MSTHKNKNYYFETLLCRPVNGVSEDKSSAWSRPGSSRPENGSFRIIYRHPPHSSDGNQPATQALGEIVMWCSTCDKWLATSEEPHTKKYHHRFTKLRRVNYNNKKPHPAYQMMKKMGQAPSKNNKVWAICESDVDPRASVSKKATTGRRGRGKSLPPTDASSKDQSNSRRSKSMPPNQQDRFTSNKKKSQDVGSIVSTKRSKNKNIEIKASTSGEIIHSSTTEQNRKRSVVDQPEGDSVSRTTKKSKEASMSSGRKRSVAAKDAENIDNRCNNGSEESSEYDDSDDEDYELEG